MNNTITAVPGITAGHASSARDATGCTVLLGPFRAAVDVRGLATGTREIDALSPNHLVPHVDAILLTGGSAPGLAAADGVVAWLRERGIGFDVGVTRIPIVPAAVIFDIHAPDQQSPDAALGRAACDAASHEPLAEGAVGAGTGATVGKLRGSEGSMPGGVGSSATTVAGYNVGAVAVVNAFGDVLDRDGSIIAGTRAADGGFMDTMQAVLHAVPAVSPITNTTICAIATDAPLSRVALQTIARMGSSAVVRRIAPANTVFDGDVVFAVSTAIGEVRELPPAELLAIGTAAQLALEEAIIRAVRH